MGNEKIRVFVAEDETIIRCGFITILEESGYEVVGDTDNGADAVTEILRLRPDIVLMDINLPKMDGLSAIEAVFEKQKIPCIIITGYRDQELVGRAVKSGVFGILQKPVDSFELQSMMQVAMRRFEEYTEAEKDAKDAKQALQNRKYIDIAKGILMDKYSYEEAMAVRFMQKKSRDKNRKLVEIAKDIIRAEKLLD